MDALVDALEHDPEKHAAALDAGWRPVFLPTNAEHVCAEIMLKKIICSAMMIHPEHVAL
jgi:hypothetical protein